MNNKKYIALISAVLIIVMSFSTVAYGGGHDTPVIPIPSGDTSEEESSSANGASGDESVSDWVTPPVDISGEEPSKEDGQAKAEKKTNTLSVKAKKPSVKYKKLKKRNQTVARKNAITVSKAKGKVTYKKKSGNKKITVNKKTGKITLKKGLKKGSYKVKIKVRAAGNATYKAKTKTVTVTIKVK